MEQIGTVETVCRYPVKSMAGEEMDAAFVGFAGVMGDRAYAFLPAGAATTGFPWHTAREQENLVLYRPKYLNQAASTFPGHVAASFALEVATPAGRTLPVDAPELAAELGEHRGKPLTLHFSERGIYDSCPVSLFGNATARALGAAMGKPMDRRRFRANFYADWTDDQPFREDHLVGRTLQLGDRLRIAVLERDRRCKMITLDPDTGEMDASIMRHVARAHDGKAGVYAAIVAEGVVRTGDPIWLL